MPSPFRHKAGITGGMRPYLGIIALLWTLLNIILLIADIREEQAWARKLALNEARAYFNKDQAFRFWATAHGGVYVPVDRETKPNPYLSHVPLRDILRPDGQLLTLMNPAYMVRQLNEKYRSLYGVAGHITSLKPLRPENAPDPWERKALESFEARGIKEVTSFVDRVGEPYLRMMRPMITESKCLKCHGAQGYTEGSIRGGVSVTMPLAGHYRTYTTGMISNAAIHVSIWVLGMVGIVFWSWYVGKNLRSRERVKERLIMSEEKYRTIFENSVEGIFQTSMAGHFITVNPSLARIFGYDSPEEMIEKTSDIGRQLYVNSRERERLKLLLAEKGRAEAFEAEVYLKNGGIIWLSINARITQHGQERYIEGNAVDITERKRAELALRESEERYRMLYTSTPVMLHSIDREGRLVSVSDHWLSIMGYARDEVIGHPSTEFLTEESRAYAKETVLPDFYRTGRCTDVPYQFVTKSGRIIDVSLSAVAEKDGEGNVVRSLAVLIDVTERKKAEEALKIKSLAIESSIDALAISDLDGTITYVNPSFVRLWGYADASEVIGTHARNHREKIPYASGIMKTLYAEGGWHGEVMAVRKDRSRFMVEVSANIVYGQKRKPLGILASFLDITERKRTEDALRESEERYRRITNSVTDYIYTVEVRDGLAVSTVHGVACKAVTGYTAEEFASDPLLWIRMVHEDDRDRVRLQTQLILTGQPSVEIEHRIIRKDGSVRWVRNTQVPHTDEGGRLVSYDGLVSDITDRKNAEEALLESERRFRTIIESTGAGYFRVGNDGLFRYVNRAWLQMHGYASPEEVIGKHFAITQEDRDMASAQKIIDHLIREKRIPQESLSRRNKDGSIGYHSLSVNPVVHGGRITGLEGFLIDITPYKKTVDALKKSEERFRDLFQAMTEGVAIHKLVYNYKGKPIDYLITDTNPAFTTHTGIDRDIVTGKKATEAYGTPAPPYFEIYERVASTGEPARFETYFEPMKRHFSISAFSPARGFFATVFEDITERIQAAEALRAAKDYAENLIQTANTMIVGLDAEGNVTIFNEAAEKLTGYYYDELAGRNWFRLMVPEERYADVWDDFQNVMASKGPTTYENPVLTKTGEKRIIAWQNSVVTEKGRIAGTISFGIDITERTIAEEKIRDSLREKELLLKEIHHRVKNNMQIIMSLLRMKADKVRDPEIAQMFQDSQNRIYSMALIHERLYQTEDFAQIDFNEYTRSLIEELFCMYNVGMSRIRYSLDIRDIHMGIDQAIPFGLVINELVTNAIKYAFPAGSTESGEITISMSQVNGSIETMVSDNGVGILESVDYKKTESSGLTLVHMIVEKQLQGSIRLSREKGTTYTILIPREYRIALNN